MDGLEQLQGKLKLMREAAEGEAARQGVTAGGNVIRDAMRSEAPVLDEKTAHSTALEPGALKADISTRVEKNKDGLITAFIGPGKRTSHVALWVERGHLLVKGGQLPWTNGKRKRSGAGRAVMHVPAHPFLRPAYDGSRRAALQEFAETAWAVLRKAVS